AQDITERQNLIDRLQRSERLYKQAQSIANLGNWTLDLGTRAFTWSEEMFKIYNVKPKEKLIEEEWIKFIHPDDKEGVLHYLNECIAKKQPYDKRHRIVLRDGTIKMVHRKGELVLDHNGEPMQMVGTTQDVTKQYKIQQELEENQNFIRKVADATPSIIAAYNVHTGKYLFINDGVRKLLGYDAKEILEKGTVFFASIIHPDDLAPLMEKNNKALQQSNLPENKNNNDIIIEFTYRLRHSNGDYRWFHTYGTIFERNSKNEVESVLNISLDITGQVTAEQRVAEQEHFIQQIADASPTVLYLFDTTTNSFQYINREVYYVLGFSPDEIIEAGDQITERLYHPDDYHLLPERKHSTKKFQLQNSMMQYECRMKDKRGNWCWFLVREIVFRKEEGKVQQILGAALDISKRKQMEKELLQNSFQLEQSNASLEEFAYVASHDLKEPLRKISTFGDRLMATQSEHLNNEGKIYLRKIVEASQRMQTMINDLLSISMITGDRSFEPYNLNTILEDVMQALEFKIEQKNAIIKADPLPEANIVPSQFRQLFQNLLSNSLKFVQENVQPVINIRHSYCTPEEAEKYLPSSSACMAAANMKEPVSDWLFAKR
ncbi:MAG: PAS domain-containing protein, partial [Flavisolibacter sp.]|nr:PAS domain-containing protein [Flavisolibacter sp.]